MKIVDNIEAEIIDKGGCRQKLSEIEGIPSAKDTIWECAQNFQG